MHSILAIARVTLKDALRKKVLFTILFFAVLLTVTSGFLPSVRPEDQMKQLTRVCLTGIAFFGMVVAIFLSAPSLPDDISKKTIFTVMTKPARRWQIIAGKVLGLGFVLAIMLAVMGTLSYGYIRIWALKMGESGNGMPRLASNKPHYADTVDYQGMTLAISEPMTGSQRAIASGFEQVTFKFSGLDKERYAGDAAFVQLTLFNHSWSFDPNTNEGAVAVDVVNPSTGEARHIVVGAETLRPSYLAFPRAMIDKNGRLEVTVSKNLPIASYSAMARSVAVLSQPAGYTMNFVKALALMFMQYMVLVFIAVSASTLLTSTVSIIFALFVYFTGSLTGILRDQALALGTQSNIFTMAAHTHGETPAMTTAQWVVNIVLRYFYLGISVVFPNLSAYDPSGSIADNLHIPMSKVWWGVWYGAIYAILAFAAAWAVFRRKEVA